MVYSSGTALVCPECFGAGKSCGCMKCGKVLVLGLQGYMTVEPARDSVTDPVDKPQHYQFFPDLEAIEVIARSMTQEQFYGYCLGNRLKYRLRAGNKDKLEQDIAKSDKYIELYEQHKQKCLDAK